jgi:phospholipid/cholesterol/gamma-HCH transport system substrate-binding protein
MRLRNEAKVGLIVFAALVLLIFVYWFLGGFSLRASSYPIHGVFANAQKLEKGADVRLAGVKVGVVREVVLTRNSCARVNMLIWNGTCIPKDSTARITTGAFVGDFYVEIIPGCKNVCLKPYERVESVQVVQFDQLMNEAGDLLTELQTTAKSINQVLGNKEMMATITDTVKALKKSAESASTLIQTAQGLIERSSPEVERTFANLARASERAVSLSEEMQMCLREDIRPNIKPLLSQTSQAMSDLSTLLEEATTLVSSLGENSGTVKEMLQRANASALQAEQMLTNLNAASASVKGLATDPEFVGNIKATARNAAEATCKASLALDAVNRKLGSFKGATQQQKSEIPLYGPSGNALWNTAKGKYRFDANYTFALAYPMFARAGLYSIGENTKVNLQAGNTFDENNALRYGLYASRVGVGYDHRFGKRVVISTDLFRPDDPQLEMRGMFFSKSGFGLFTGVQDLLDVDNRDFLVGVAYNK